MTGPVWPLVDFGVSFGTTTLLFAMIYKILPDVNIGWRDVWLALGLVPCGLVILLWAIVGPWEYIFISLVPLGLLALVAVGFQVVQHQRGDQFDLLRRDPDGLR